ncbi:hypothetical protein F5Y16DRAFT_154027 [Xylariaceae sp. FL0255]|nr:hypothetical protein F5Y16DRAFT_154027 [Xylariaceae sp. FL0255]
MDTINALVARGSAVFVTRDTTDDGSSNTIDHMILILGLVLLGLSLSGLLFAIRRLHRQRELRARNALPKYDDIEHDAGRNTNRLTIQTSQGKSSIVVVNGRPMLADPNSPPHSPRNIPEIHITFPDEHDEQGRQKSGRVLLVRVGETTVGLEPLQDEQLPAYEKESKDNFYSIDIDHIGGLKEKDRSHFA